MSNAPTGNLLIIGWREWLSLPALGAAQVKAKIDTGARSSALHASDIERFQQNGEDWVRFYICPDQRSQPQEGAIAAHARLLDVRNIRSSSGQVQQRPIIQTMAKLGPYQWPIELSLTNRDEMGFRMLLGRQAIRQRFLVDSGQSYLQSSQRAIRRRAKNTTAVPETSQPTPNLPAVPPTVNQESPVW